MTRWWPDYKLSADTSLEDEIRKCLDPDGIRIMRDDAFQTFMSEKNLAAKAKSFVKGESSAECEMVLVNGVVVAGGIATWD
jgi:hypothetical protein